MPTIYVLARALEELITAAEQALPRETGGILLGFRIGGDVRVERVHVVPDEGASGTSYVRSQDAAQKLLDEELRREPLDTYLGWVGEWHSHPESSGPSRRDMRELVRLARRDGQAVGLIVLVRGRLGWTADARVASSRHAHRAELEIGADLRSKGLFH